MTDDIRRAALARDISRRLQLVSLADLRLLDRLLIGVEQQRDRRWERRLATDPGDVDTLFHLVDRISGGSVITKGCNGRWPIGDAVETQSPAPPIAEMCPACLRAATAPEWLGTILSALAEHLAIEDRDRAALHEAARDEIVSGDPDPGLRAEWDARPTVVAQVGDTADSSDHPEPRRWRR